MPALEADHAAKVVVVTVAQDQCIETCGIDVKNCHVVQQHFRRVAEIDQDMTGLITTLGFGAHGEPPFTVKRGAWRAVGRKVAAGVPLNS